MGLTILTTIWGILKPALSSPLFWLVLIVFAVAFHFGRSCRPPRPPRPPRETSFEVVDAVNGAALTCKAGLAGRREITVSLESIQAPADGQPFAGESKANLQKLAGKQIRVETQRGRLFGEPNSEEQSEDTQGTVEARGPIVGTIYGESGVCLNLAQVAFGWATCTDAAPKSWKQAETSAKKARVGIWKEKP
jgi:endonuclease YncB( thermonuclease family)